MGTWNLEKTVDSTEFLEYNDRRKNKTKKGGNIVDIRLIKPKMFSTRNARDPTDLHKLFAAERPLSCLSNEDPFYLPKRTIPFNDPRSDKWFFKQKLERKNLLYLLERCLQKQTSLSWKTLTNQSARKHLVKKLRNGNAPQRDIMQNKRTKTCPVGRSVNIARKFSAAIILSLIIRGQAPCQR